MQPGFDATCRLNDGGDLWSDGGRTANNITFKQLDGTTRAVWRKDIASIESTKAR
jgi:hypothetical protein